MPKLHYYIINFMTMHTTFPPLSSSPSPSFQSSPSINASPSKSSPNLAAPPPIVLSPCAACKILRRRCDEKCVLAPYFPPTEPQNFIIVHRVFGASNIIKCLQVCMTGTIISSNYRDRRSWHLLLFVASIYPCMY